MVQQETKALDLPEKYMGGSSWVECLSSAPHRNKDDLRVVHIAYFVLCF